jgi:glycyl-tRNA synthetase beta chain
VANISKDIDLESDLAIDTALFKEDAEVTLYTAYEKVINQEYTDYKTQLEALFGLKRELDSYFDDVMVNTDNEALKVNRLHTIGSVYKTFKRIADIKEISV